MGAAKRRCETHTSVERSRPSVNVALGSEAAKAAHCQRTCHACDGAAAGVRSSSHHVAALQVCPSVYATKAWQPSCASWPVCPGASESLAMHCAAHVEPFFAMRMHAVLLHL